MVEAPPVPANGLLGDVPLQIIPFRALVRDRLLRGEAPLWAGEMGTGEPLLGNAQSAPFSLLGLLALPLPAVRSLPVMAALKLFLSLLLTDGLLAALGAGRAGACFARAYSRASADPQQHIKISLCGWQGAAWSAILPRQTGPTPGCRSPPPPPRHPCRRRPP